MAKDFVVLPDVTCDLSEELRKEYDIEFVRGHLSYPNGKEENSFLKWSDCSYLANPCSETFYAELKKNPDGFKTAPANIQEFYNAFEEYIKAGKDVLSMSISSGISGTYNFTLQAKKLILEKYPDAKVYCIDSLRFGPGFGLMAVYASILRSEGKTIEEVVDYLETNKNRFHQMGWLDDLTFVAKKGRITHSKAFFGTLVGVKPIGECDYNGMTTVIGKLRGEESAYKTMIEYIRQTIENPTEQIIFIAQTNRRKQAEKYKVMIEETFHPKAVYINEVFPACGINVGPGLMAAYYVGKPISKDLQEEKDIINNIISK